jgi:hypothetical protein
MFFFPISKKFKFVGSKIIFHTPFEFFKNYICLDPFGRQIWCNAASQMNTDPYESESAVLLAKVSGSSPQCILSATCE